MNPAPESTMRVIASLVAYELSCARGDGFDRVSRLAWSAGTSLDSSGIGIDSLELVAVATAVSDFYCLDDTGEEDRLFIDRSLGAWATLSSHARELGATGMVFRTSGTTGEPKRVRHELGVLDAETSAFAERFSGRTRVISLVAPHHMYGFIHGVLVPGAMGVPVVDAEFSIRSSVAGKMREGDLVVATPTMWRELAASARNGFPPGVRGVSSGEPMPESTWSMLLELGLDGLTDVYGSTETGALATRTTPDGTFEALDVDRCRELAPDELTWTDDRSFRIEGRRDGCVQVAGVNVSPSFVGGVLEQHPGVDRCVARLCEGKPERLEAVVVPAGASTPSNSDDLTEELGRFAAERLPAVARPAKYTIVTSIPTGPLGKPAVWRASA